MIFFMKLLRWATITADVGMVIWAIINWSNGTFASGMNANTQAFFAISITLFALSAFMLIGKSLPVIKRFF